MAPPRPWHSDLDTQVPVAPVEVVHSLLGKVTIWNKLNTDMIVVCYSSEFNLVSVSLLQNLSSKAAFNSLANFLKFF